MPDEAARARRGVLTLASALLSLAVAGVVAWALFELDEPEIDLGRQVAANLSEAGVDHPVTAVLLRFRAYDTALEVIVLLLAAAGALVVRRSTDALDAPPPEPAGPILDWLTRALVPLALVVAVYLLWLGTHAPGGAFQAGAVLGAAALLAQRAGYRALDRLAPAALRASLTAGALAFFGLGALFAALGYALFELPEKGTGAWVVAIELAVTVSVAATFATLFAAARPASAADPDREAP